MLDVLKIFFAILYIGGTILTFSITKKRWFPFLLTLSVAIPFTVIISKLNSYLDSHSIAFYEIRDLYDFVEYLVGASWFSVMIALIGLMESNHEKE